MIILTPGHLYELAKFEENAGGRPAANPIVVQFIEKEPVSFGSTELRTVNDGTTNEEVLRMMIDRMNYLQGKFPCRENAIAITKLEEALLWLEKRTRDRTARGVEGTNQK